jgi:hypothetical protein
MREGGASVDAIAPLCDKEAQIRSALGFPRPARTTKGAELKRDLPLNDCAKMALAYAAQEANMDGEYWIDTDNILRGILCFPNEANSVLQTISLDLDKARAASRRHRKAFPPKKTLYHRLFGSPFRAHRILLLKWLIFLIVITLGSLLIRWIN